MSKVTPCLETIQVPNNPNLYIDIGLWPHEKSPQLTIQIYFSMGGNCWYSPAAPLNLWEVILSESKKLWEKHACGTCNGKGCDKCGNMGWNRYIEWCEKGKKEKPDKPNYVDLE